MAFTIIIIIIEPLYINLNIHIMKKCVLFFVVTVCFIFSGCSSDEFPKQASDSYVLAYGYNPLSVEVGNGNVLSIVMVDSKSEDYPYYSNKSKGGDIDIYHSLCAKHSDTSYPEEFVPETLYNECYYKDFKSLDIVCEESFDKSHPAGSSLNDIITFSTTSVSEYISKGYAGEETRNIEKSVKDLAPADLTLLPAYIPLFYLHFDSNPEVSGTYSISIILTTDDDEVITLTTDVKF